MVLSKGVLRAKTNYFQLCVFYISGYKKQNLKCNILKVLSELLYKKGQFRTSDNFARSKKKKIITD